jgi:hypothetical protein
MTFAKKRDIRSARIFLKGKLVNISTKYQQLTFPENIKHIHVITTANQAYPVQSATHIGISSNR